MRHNPWCMSGSLAPSGGEKFPGIPGACAPEIFRIVGKGLISRAKLFGFHIYAFRYRWLLKNTWDSNHIRFACSYASLCYQMTMLFDSVLEQIIQTKVFLCFQLGKTGGGYRHCRMLHNSLANGVPAYLKKPFCLLLNCAKRVLNYIISSALISLIATNFI